MPETNGRAEGDGADARRALAPLEQAAGDVAMRVDWLPASALGDVLPGRLGLTFLPGKHGISSRYPDLVYRRTLEEDLEQLRSDGVRFLLLLVEDPELERWGDPAIVERAAAHGIVVRRHPIADGGIPASAEDVTRLLVELGEARRGGDAAIACMGGVGRTGMIAACALVSAGASAADAIATVRKVRHPDAVETSAQEAFVESYARLARIRG